ncbi:MAG TPA: PLP-dependent aminotransferase family protein [Chloroflexota bacterium]
MSVDWKQRYAHRTTRMRSSAIRELLKITERPDVISFAGGLPAPELFPVDEVAAVSERVLRKAGKTALQYGPTEGYRPLRELLADQMRGEGVPATADHVLITTGSQQAIDLVGKILLDPGDRVVVESPTYLAALQAWNAYEAEFVAVPSDDSGMNVDAVEALGSQPAMIYALPNFQNPRGITLAMERRHHLVDVARRHGIAILEDDPYHDLRFSGEHLPRLVALDAARDDGVTYAGNVISLGTFSKILAPGLRVGWVLAPREVIEQLTQAKQGADLHTSMLDQMIAYEMLESGYLREHTKVLVQTYRHRRDVMLEALEEHFPAGVRWTRPEGGMFLWVEFPEAVDVVELLRAAREEKVAFVPGHGFHCDRNDCSTLRLNFSNSSPERIRDGISRLRGAFDSLLCPHRGGERSQSAVMSTAGALAGTARES